MICDGCLQEKCNGENSDFCTSIMSYIENGEESKEEEKACGE